MQILAVDDEEHICRIYRRVLVNAGYHIETVGSGEEALKRLRKGRYDLLLVELILPGMHGMELIKEAKDMAKGMPIIVVTAYATLNSIIETLRLGAHDYLPKPFEINDLLAKIKKALD